MPWLLLLLAAAFEITWATGLAFTNGFTRLWPSIGVIVALGISVYLLSLATRDLPVGTAYAVWTGLGAFGTAIGGIALLGEPATALRIASLGLILLGVVGLKLSGP